MSRIIKLGWYVVCTSKDIPITRTELRCQKQCDINCTYGCKYCSECGSKLTSEQTTLTIQSHFSQLRDQEYLDVSDDVVDSIESKFWDVDCDDLPSNQSLLIVIADCVDICQLLNISYVSNFDNLHEIDPSMLQLDFERQRLVILEWMKELDILLYKSVELKYGLINATTPYD